MEKAISFVENIDTNIFLKMSDKELNQFIQQIDILENEIKSLL